MNLKMQLPLYGIMNERLSSVRCVPVHVKDDDGFEIGADGFIFEMEGIVV